MAMKNPWSSQGPKPGVQLKPAATKPTAAQMKAYEGSAADKRQDARTGTKEGSKADNAMDAKGAMQMAKKSTPAPSGKPFNPAANLGAYHHPKKATVAPVAAPMKPATTAKIGPNTTAPAKARSVTAGPSGSFPIGDATHARLAIPMSTRSERAGNITPAQAATIKSKARAMLAKGK